MVRLASLVESLGGTCELAGRESPRVVDVKLDSRCVAGGDLFAALPGERADGRRFVPDALRRGAVAVLAPGALPRAVDAPLWIHPQARRVAGLAAAAVHAHPSKALRVVAVTGTNGKTTVAHLVGHLFACAGERPAVIGTVSYRLADGEERAVTTTPDAPTLQRLLARHLAAGGTACAVELSSHALVQDRDAGLAVDVAVFTNLSRDHLDYHRSMDEYASAKERLFARLAPGTSAVLNADDERAPQMRAAAEAAGAHVVTYSTRSRADLVAVRWSVARRGTHLFLDGMGIPRAGLFLPLLGRHNIENALAATAAVLRSGASPSDAFEGLATAIPPPGRLEPVPEAEAGHGFTVLVDYAHTPAALESALACVREILAGEGEGRLLCVFGCGGDRDRGKRPEMGAAAARLADVAIVTSDNPRGEDPGAIVAEVVRGMHEGGAERVCVTDRREAIGRALELARPGDVVLIAGKGHERVQITSRGTRPFDDRSVVREALA